MSDISLDVRLCLQRLGHARNIAERVRLLQTDDSPLLRKILIAAHSPFIRYGVVITPSIESKILADLRTLKSPAGLLLDESDIWDMLDLFSSSTASSASKIITLTSLLRRLSMDTTYTVLDILKKNCAPGLGVSTINKAFPGLIPTFDVQRCNKYSDKKVKDYPVYVEPKYDGMRAIATVLPTGDVTVVSRSGRDIPAAKFFHEQLRILGLDYIAHMGKQGIPISELKGVVIDGEVLGESFNDSISIFRGSTTASTGTFQVFDILPLSVIMDDKYESKPYKARREDLTALFKTVYSNLALAPNYQANSKHEIWDLYQRARGAGLEGVIVKAGDSRWTKKRSNDWLKIKAEESIDLRVIGAFEGEGAMVGTLGGLIVEFPNPKTGGFTEVSVGSGLTDRDRADIWSMFIHDLQEIAKGSDDFQVIGKIIEIQYQEVTPDHSLRHPVFKKLRLDKDEVSF